MGRFFEYVPQIIDAAAKSDLGLLALMILVLAFLSFGFFRRATWRIKIEIVEQAIAKICPH